MSSMKVTGGGMLKPAIRTSARCLPLSTGNVDGSALRHALAGEHGACYSLVHTEQVTSVLWYTVIRALTGESATWTETAARIWRSGQWTRCFLAYIRTHILRQHLTKDDSPKAGRAFHSGVRWRPALQGQTMNSRGFEPTERGRAHAVGCRLLGVILTSCVAMNSRQQVFTRLPNRGHPLSTQ